MKPIRSSVAWLLACAALVALPARSVRADDRVAAKAAYLEGTRFYEIGEFPKALDAFKRAYLDYPEPSLLFNLGQCYRQIGDKPEALRSYRQFLNKVPNAPNRSDIERLIGNLEASIAAEKTAREAPPQEPMNDRPKEAAEPSTARPPANPVIVAVESKPAVDKRPVYKKWWLWTLVGGAAAVGLGVGLGVGLTRANGTSTSLPDFGPGVGRSGLVLR